MTFSRKNHNFLFCGLDLCGLEDSLTKSLSWLHMRSKVLRDGCVPCGELAFKQSLTCYVSSPLLLSFSISNVVEKKKEGTCHLGFLYLRRALLVGDTLFHF
jgi:hypothetical protein